MHFLPAYRVVIAMLPAPFTFPEAAATVQVALALTFIMSNSWPGRTLEVGSVVVNVPLHKITWSVVTAGYVVVLAAIAERKPVTRVLPPWISSLIPLALPGSVIVPMPSRVLPKLLYSAGWSANR